MSERVRQLIREVWAQEWNARMVWAAGAMLVLALGQLGLLGGIAWKSATWASAVDERMAADTASRELRFRTVNEKLDALTASDHEQAAALNARVADWNPWRAAMSASDARNTAYVLQHENRLIFLERKIAR